MPALIKSRLRECKALYGRQMAFQAPVISECEHLIATLACCRIEFGDDALGCIACNKTLTRTALYVRFMQLTALLSVMQLRFRIVGVFIVQHFIKQRRYILVVFDSELSTRPLQLKTRRLGCAVSAGRNHLEYSEQSAYVAFSNSKRSSERSKYNYENNNANDRREE